MSEFQKEHRYYVFKRKNLGENLDWEVKKLTHKGYCPDCVVVERDWPEHDVVWNMIQARVEGKPNIIEEQQATIESLHQQVGELEEKQRWRYTETEPPLAPDELVLVVLPNLNVVSDEVSYIVALNRERYPRWRPAPLPPTDPQEAGS